jgi:biotin carboxylase
MSGLLLVGVGLMGRPYLDAAAKLGIPVHLVESAANTEAQAGRVRSTHIVHGSQEEQWVEAAVRAARVTSPDGVLAFSEGHVLAAAIVADQYGLAGPSLHAAVVSRNKALQRALFAADGVPQPASLLVAKLADAHEWVDAHLPVVIKPTSASGSAGVEYVSDMQEFGDAVDRRRYDSPLLVEEAVQGPEYSWEAVVSHGEVWLENVTQKRTTGPPHFIETGHCIPAALVTTEATTVAALGRQVLKSLRMGTGIVHLEFRLASAGPSVMEVAVRTPGDHIMDMLGIVYGVDWFEFAVRAALGLPLPTPGRIPQAVAASLFPIAGPGRVTAVHGVEALCEMPGVVEAAVTVAPGDIVSVSRSSMDRVGRVVLRAETARELALLEQKVHESLVVTTEPTDSRRPA